MKNLEILRRTPISEQELSWFRENGGGGEGIVLFTTTSIAPSLKGKAVYFDVIPLPDIPHIRHDLMPTCARLTKKCKIGEKSPALTSPGLFGASLLTKSLSPMDCPLFIELIKPQSIVTAVALVGLHINDFGGVHPLDDDYDRLRVQAVSFHLIDALTLGKTPALWEERQISLGTAVGVPRLIKIAEDWQGRLKAVRPFRFRNWNEVLDVIAV